MDSFTLATPRLKLSAPTPDDAGAIREHCQDPLLSRYIPAITQPYTLEKAREFIGFAEEGWHSGTELTWGIRAAGDLVGVISLRRVTADDIGFWLGARHRGHGYMPEAVGAVLDWAFDPSNPLRVESVGWECLIGNTASAAVARKCGFTFEGEGPGRRADSSGEHPLSWRGRIWAADSREEKPGWPVV
ncbi:GNAT family N-acetyltransferase [Salinibacterium sp. SYSU T00001]|uniref:GNAT family N-acetyltransferase n=1 Tax=Homoserinimonas sedimenticola TaxID=2986805 RepID=UPI002236A437|nr:GNAT family N-acetyltransferase [Salinibacterium sedimenticola]MCW4385125.1 GNAT family N-acetyltransferase [Salinibacterium sedimenticola]